MIFVTQSVNLHYVLRQSLRLDWASLSLLGYTKHHKFLENTHAVIYSNVLDRHTTVACLTYLHRDINHTNTYTHRYMRDGWNVIYTPPRFLIFGTYIPRLCIYVTRASSFNNENVKNLPKRHMVGAALWKLGGIPIVWYLISKVKVGLPPTHPLFINLVVFMTEKENVTKTHCAIKEFMVRLFKLVFSHLSFELPFR